MSTQRKKLLSMPLRRATTWVGAMLHLFVAGFYHAMRSPRALSESCLVTTERRDKLHDAAYTRE